MQRPEPKSNQPGAQSTGHGQAARAQVASGPEGPKEGAASPRTGPDQTHLQLASALEKTRSGLLDTTPRSRLLNYRETATDVAVLNENLDQVFQRLVQAGGEYWFDPGRDTVAQPQESSAGQEAESAKQPTASPDAEAAAAPASDSALAPNLPEKGAPVAVASQKEATASRESKTTESPVPDAGASLHPLEAQGDVCPDVPADAAGSPDPETAATPGPPEEEEGARQEGPTASLERETAGPPLPDGGLSLVPLEEDGPAEADPADGTAASPDPEMAASGASDGSLSLVHLQQEGTAEADPADGTAASLDPETASSVSADGGLSLVPLVQEDAVAADPGDGTAASPDTEMGGPSAPDSAAGQERREVDTVAEVTPSQDPAASPDTETRAPSAPGSVAGQEHREVDQAAGAAPSQDSPASPDTGTQGPPAPGEAVSPEPPEGDVEAVFGPLEAPPASPDPVTAAAPAPVVEDAGAPDTPTSPEAGQVLFQLPQAEEGGAGGRDDRLQTALSERALMRRLGRLHDEQRRAVEETGTSPLHLAIGFLRWYDGADPQTPRAAPLILLPVRLEKERQDEGVVYRLGFHGEALDTNHALYEKLKRDFAITLPLFSDEQTPEVYWREAEASFIDHAEEGWTLVPEMALGLFPVDRQAIWHDLEPSRWLIRTPLLDHPVVQRILLAASEAETPPGELKQIYDQDPTEAGAGTTPVTLIRDADAFQYSALVDALGQREGLVIEGPPGTGKSQTITNLIAGALDKGLSVLFVAEKTAALEVVQQRLVQAGIDDFCLELYGLKTSTGSLLQSIVQRLAHEGADPAQFEPRRKALRQTREELIAVSKALSQPAGPERLPLHDVVWCLERLRRALPENFSPSPVPAAERLDLSSFQKLRGFFGELGKGGRAIPKKATKAWYGFVPTRYQASQQAGVADSLREMLAAIDVTMEWLATEEATPVAPFLSNAGRLVKLGAMEPGRALPPLANGADPALAQRLVQSGRLSEFQELLERLIDYRQAVSIVDRIFDSGSDQAETYAQTLQKHAGLLVGKLCGASVLLVDLPKELEQLKAIAEAIETLPKLAEPVTGLLGASASTLKDYAMVADQAEKLASGPGELWLHANPVHAKAIAAERLASALERRDNLKMFAEAALGLFALEKMPDLPALKQAHLTIQESKSRFGAHGSEYRGAKDLIRATLRNPRTFSPKPKFLGALEKFIQYCEWCQQFEQSEFYRESFGSQFRGLDSDWRAMERLVGFAQELKKKLGEAEAERLLSDWEGHVRVMGRARSGLSEVVEQVRKYADGHELPDTLWQRPTGEVTGALRQWAADAATAFEAIRQPWCNGRVSLGDALGAVEGYRRAKQSEQVLRSHPAFESLLSPYWKGAATDLVALKAVKAWVDASLKVDGVDLNLLRWLMPDQAGLSRERLDPLVLRAGWFRKVLNGQYNLLKQLGEMRLSYWLGAEDPSLASFRRKLAACLDTLGDLSRLARWRFVHQEVCKHGYEALAHAVTAGQLDGEKCSKAFEYSVYSTVLEKALAANPLLGSFDSASHDALRGRFARLDREVLVANGGQIAAKLCRAHVPEGVDHGLVNTFTEKGLLAHEAGRTWSDIPLRKLLQRASKALLALKPCFLMSPLSVAQYLPPGQVEFDLVVLDEASRLRTADVLGAIARGSKVIVVGDSRQLPPPCLLGPAGTGATNVDEGVGDDTDSILNVCLKRFPRRHLRRHYRSRHDSLIQFCNDQFYDRSLFVLPSPRGGSRERAVHATLVEQPSYGDGRNRGEAEAVVAHIVSHHRRYPDKSLGVVASTRGQAQSIERLLEVRRAEDPALDQLLAGPGTAEPLFIKSPESVQGDERDVIFVSTTFGPAKAGEPIDQHFGSLGSDLGWRVLNVMATRARQRTEVFTSLQAADIHDEGAASRGVRALRAYLEYAASEDQGLGPGDGRAPEGDFELTVAQVIEELGYRPEFQVSAGGFSIDLGVVHPDRPGEYLLGVDCDAGPCRVAMGARERDRLRQELLEDKGWTLHRIWSMGWYRTRQAEIDRLRQAIEKCLQANRKPAGEQAGGVLEVLGTAPQATSQQIAQEEMEEQQSLAEALDRFWEKNIRPGFPGRGDSILSSTVIECLVTARPLTVAGWETAVPAALREGIDPRQMVFLVDILGVIADFA